MLWTQYIMKLGSKTEKYFNGSFFQTSFKYHKFDLLIELL